MSADTLDHVIQETTSALLPVFSIQPDESTDVANSLQLLVYVRCINDGDFKVEFLQTLKQQLLHVMYLTRIIS